MIEMLISGTVGMNNFVKIVAPWGMLDKKILSLINRLLNAMILICKTIIPSVLWLFTDTISACCMLAHTTYLLNDTISNREVSILSVAHAPVEEVW